MTISTTLALPWSFVDKARLLVQHDGTLLALSVNSARVDALVEPATLAGWQARHHGGEALVCIPLAADSIAPAVLLALCRRHIARNRLKLRLQHKGSG